MKRDEKFTRKYNQKHNIYTKKHGHIVEDVVSVRHMSDADTS